jgi:hypothetical protein
LAAALIAGGSSVGCGDDTGECVPREKAAELVASQEGVAEGEADFARGDGRWSGTLDASLGGRKAAKSSSFLYLDLDEGVLLELSDVEAFEDERWEMAFKRTEIRINSADSGPRELRLARVENTSFEEASPPATDSGSWRTDDFVDESCEVSTFGRGTTETAFAQWYDYNFLTHQVSAPEGVVYFLHDPAAETTTRFQIVDYRDAVYELRWEREE